MHNWIEIQLDGTHKLQLKTLRLTVILTLYTLYLVGIQYLHIIKSQGLSMSSYWWLLGLENTTVFPGRLRQTIKRRHQGESGNHYESKFLSRPFFRCPRMNVVFALRILFAPPPSALLLFCESDQPSARTKSSAHVFFFPARASFSFSPTRASPSIFPFFF